MARSSSASLLLISFLLLGAALGRAENWPGWRGPEGNGVSHESRLPLHWSVTNNIRWKTKIPGAGFSSPIVWQNRVFVTSAFEDGARRAVHCLDRPSGKILWSREIKCDSPELASSMTGHAPATPATDGRRVVAFFGNAGVVCYTMTGTQLWQIRFGDFESELGLASSPVIQGDRVILLCDHDGNRFRTFDSFLIALRLRDGRTLWKTERSGIFRSWSTPLLVPGRGRKLEVIVNAQEQLRAYDFADGKLLWWVSGMNDWVTPSPVFGSELIFAASGKKGPLLAVRPGGLGDVTASQVLWKHPKAGPYVCSPLLYRDSLYVNDETGDFACYEARTGRLRYRRQLEGKFTASPVAGDGKIYATSDEGITYVIKAGPEFMELARNSLDEYSLASPAISGGDLFLRTELFLYCIRP
jgi:outer membrane protein assembly factor BamB